MDRSHIKVEKFGHIRYVEPSNIFDEYNGVLTESPKNGTFSDAINFKYEDYNMAVDLQVDISNRYSCGISDNSTKSFFYSSTNHTLSFLGGKKINGSKEDSPGYLTTSFTDVSNLNPDQDGECFGIESISITYQSWLFPEVNIKFIDVRGAAVMQPNEYGVYNEGQTDVPYNLIYKSFFIYPYPVYTLRVKGFYGMGVSYKLALKGTSIEFDSNTGNFIIDAQFIGYMFGIYTDVPLSFIASAPFLEDGKEYWKQKCSEINGFRFRDENGNDSGPMLTIPQFRTRIAEASKKYGDAYTQLIESMNTESNETEYDNNAQIAALTALYQKKDILDTLGNKLLFYTNWSDEYDIALYDYIKNDDIEKQLVESIDDIVNSFKDYDKNFNDNKSAFLSFKEKTNIPKNYNSVKNPYDNYGITSLTLSKDLDGNFEVSNKDVVLRIYKISGSSYVREDYEGIPKENSPKFIYDSIGQEKIEKIVTDAINIISKKDNSSFVSVITIIFIPKVNKEININTVFEKTQESIIELKNLIDKKIEIKNKELILEIQKAIGFYPSIRNIYNMMFAHFDTFIHCFYERMKKIKAEFLKGEGSSRYKKGISGVDEKLTDTSSVYSFIDNEEYKDFLNFYPPFTAFYRKDDKENKMVFAWPPDIDQQLNNFEEIQFVYDLLAASGDVDGRGIPDVRDKVEEGKDLTPQEGYFVNYNRYIPLTIYDYKFYNNSVNPYYENGLKFLRPDKDNYDYAGAELLAKFAIRVVGTENNIINEKTFKHIGEKEAINVFNAIGKKNYSSYTDNFLKKLATFTSEEFINWLTEKNQDKKSKFSKPFKKPPFLLKNKGNKNSELEYSLLQMGYNGVAYPTSFSRIYDLVSDSETEAWNNFPNNYNSEEFKDIKKNYALHFNNDFDNIFYSTNLFLYLTETEAKLVSSERLDLDDITNDSISNFYIDKDFEANKRNAEGFITSVYFDRFLDSDFYKAQDDFYLKAFLFLQPVSKDIIDGTCGTKYDDETKLKINFIREGSYYWMCDWLNEGHAIVWPEGYTNHPNIVASAHSTKVKLETFYKDNNGFIRFEKEPTKERRELAKNEFIKFADSIAPYFYTIYEEKVYKNETSTTFSSELLGKKDNLSLDFQELQKILFDIYYERVKTITKKGFSIKKEHLEIAFNSFKTKLASLSKENLLNNEKEIRELLNKNNIIYNPYGNPDLALSLYLTLKNLYDKWLSFADGNYEQKWSLTAEGSDFNNFLFIDNFYHDIGYKFSVNPTKISSWLGRYFPSSEIENGASLAYETGKTFYEFLADIAQECGATLMAFPQNFAKIGDSGDENIRKMFTPVSLREKWYDDSSVFVFMYSYQPASHLGDEDDSTAFNMNGFNSNGDGFDLSDEEIMGLMSEENNDDTTLPAFGVSFGKQNQAIFKNITLNNKTTTVTEASIAGTMNIASKAGEGPRETTLFGQDIYKIYGLYSYECSIEMMGNLQIMPTMFLQLNNIPLWKGIYQIKKVSHDIKAGDIVTKLEAIKVNKYCVPIMIPQLILTRTSDGKNDYDVKYNKGIKPSSSKTIQNTDENPNVDITSYIGSTSGKYVVANVYTDFSGKGITPEHPLICLTCVHNSTGPKKKEYEWSSLISNRIADKLRKLSNKEKYSWLEDHVHICNEHDRNIRPGDIGKTYYTMIETKQLSSRYGNKCIVSIAPHWNTSELATPNRLEVYWKWKNDSPAHKNSEPLAECFVNAYHNLKKVDERLNTMPENAINFDKINIGSLVGLAGRGDDGAVRLDCPGVLVETWFATYNKQDINFLKSIPDDINTRKDTSGKFVFMGGWMFSPEGLDYISDFYVNAITEYLDKLPELNKE